MEVENKICARCGYIRTAEDDIRFKHDICPSCSAYYKKSEKYFGSDRTQKSEPESKPNTAGPERLASYALLSSLVFLVVAAVFLSYFGIVVPWWAYALAFFVFFGSAYQGLLKNAALAKYLNQENRQGAPPPSTTGENLPSVDNVTPRRTGEIFSINRKLGSLDYFFIFGVMGLTLYIFVPPISGSYEIAAGGAACASTQAAREFQIVRRKGFFSVGRFLSANDCLIGPHRVSVTRRATVFHPYAKVRSGGQDWYVFRDDLVRKPSISP